MSSRIDKPHIDDSIDGIVQGRPAVFLTLSHAMVMELKSNYYHYTPQDTLSLMVPLLKL